MVTIEVTPDSEIARGLREAEQSGKPLRVDTGEAVSAVRPTVEPRGGPEPEDIWTHYDAAKVLAALDASAGALAGVDIERLLADLREQREQDSQGRPAH